jgi:hypothetical protein
MAGYKHALSGKLRANVPACLDPLLPAGESPPRYATEPGASCTATQVRAKAVWRLSRIAFTHATSASSIVVGRPPIEGEAIKRIC